jgi:hypothetical protein
VQEVVEAARGCEKVRKGVKRSCEGARRCCECFGCYERAQEGWRGREGMIYEGSYTISNTVSRKETRWGYGLQCWKIPVAGGGGWQLQSVGSLWLGAVGRTVVGDDPAERARECKKRLNK